jgi:hypothetical protein
MKTQNSVIASEILEMVNSIIDHRKWGKKYWVRLNLREKSPADSDENYNQIFGDDTVVQLLNMPRAGRTPISFTAAEKHRTMLYLLGKGYYSIEDYCAKFDRHIEFGPNELLIIDLGNGMII